MEFYGKYIYIGFSNEDGHNDDDVDLNMKK